jgi:putative tryptophan/tyrosine transport system substrate-binding protein
MRRRAFIAGLAAAAWPVVARAQQREKVRRLGVLIPRAAFDADTQSYLTAFKSELQSRGWVEGRTIATEVQFAANAADRVTSARKLVASTPDVILAVSSLVLGAIAKETSTIPITFVQVTDPVGTGFVSSLAHPGGNITGLTNFEFSMGGKWLDLLREIAPNINRVLVIVHPDNAGAVGMMPAIQSAAQSIGWFVTVLDVRDVAKNEESIAAFARQPNGGVIIHPSATQLLPAERIVPVVNRHGLPALYAYRFYPAAGGLMSYSFDAIEHYRQAATYVDRILRGAKPSDMPVQQPTKFQLTINLKTANALGLTVPAKFLFTADEVIE